MAASIAQVIQYQNQQASIIIESDKFNKSNNKRLKTWSYTLKDPIITKQTSDLLSKKFTNILNHYFQQNIKFFKAKKICNYIYIGKQTDGLVYKIIITTYLPLILAYWFNRLYKEYNKNKVLHYTASMSNIEKAKARQTFNTDDFK